MLPCHAFFFGNFIFAFIAWMFSGNRLELFESALESLAKRESSLVYSTTEKILCPVVQKPINANPGLKLNRAFNFFGLKDF